MNNYLIWEIQGKIYILHTTKKYKTMSDATKFFNKYMETNHIDLKKFNNEIIERTKGQISNEMEFANVQVSSDEKFVFFHTKYADGTQPIENIVWVE